MMSCHWSPCIARPVCQCVGGVRLLPEDWESPITTLEPEIRGEEPRPDPPSTHRRDTDTGTYTKIWYLEKIHDMMHDILILRQLSTICQQPVDVRNVPEQ